MSKPKPFHEIPPGTKLKWLTGKPKAKGWWMASTDKDPRSWRWWDGVQWSLNVHSNRAANTAARRAKKPSRDSDRVQYTTYYPANARVPRPA